MLYGGSVNSIVAFLPSMSFCTFVYLKASPHISLCFPSIAISPSCIFFPLLLSGIRIPDIRCRRKILLLSICLFCRIVLSLNQRRCASYPVLFPCLFVPYIFSAAIASHGYLSLVCF